MSAEDVLKNTCSFCVKKDFCTDKTMVKGLNKLIKEVAPGLRLNCSKYQSSLTTTPDWMNAVEIFKCNEVNC